MTSPTEGRRILVVIATYDERENLPHLLPEIWSTRPDVDILIIDDHSPDGTGDWVDDQMRSEPRLKCIHRERKLGLGTAAVRATRYAIDNGYDLLINMDGDFSHDPKYLPAMIEAMDRDPHGPRDVVIGSRYIAGGGTHGWPLYRRLMSKLVNAYARWWLRLPLRDCSGGYRCFRVAKLREIDFNKIRAHGYVFHEEVLWHLHRLGARMGESPIIFVDRRFGSSKIRSRDAIAAVWRILVLGFRDRFSKHPRQS